jgi:hypothetical protein
MDENLYKNIVYSSNTQGLTVSEYIRRSVKTNLNDSKIQDSDNASIQSVKTIPFVNRINVFDTIKKIEQSTPTFKNVNVFDNIRKWEKEEN